MCCKTSSSTRPIGPRPLREPDDDDDERELILADLMAALREHNHRLKIKASLKLVEQIDGFQERKTCLVV